MRGAAGRRHEQGCGLLQLEGQGARFALTFQQREGRYWGHEHARHDRRLLARVAPQRQDPAPLPRGGAAGAQRGRPGQRLSLLLRGPDPARPGDPPTPGPAYAGSPRSNRFSPRPTPARAIGSSSSISTGSSSSSPRHALRSGNCATSSSPKHRPRSNTGPSQPPVPSASERPSIATTSSPGGREPSASSTPRSGRSG